MLHATLLDALYSMPVKKNTYINIQITYQRITKIRELQLTLSPFSYEV
jgi:hypothetical protein